MGTYGKYCIVCSIIAVVLLAICFLGFLIYYAAAGNKQIDKVKDAEKNTVVIRYYMSDDINSSPIGYMRVEKNSEFIINDIPQKDGYAFIAWFDGPNVSSSTQYTDTNGVSLLTIDHDIILYPIFEKEA